MTTKLFFAVVLSVLAYGSHAHAQGDFEMTEITAAADAPLVIGGAPVDPSVWPATLRFRSYGGSCTSTVVGAKSILTAAHCIEDGASGRVTLSGGSVNVTCSHHPDYENDYQLDVAMCLSDNDIPLDANARYETLNANPAVPSKDQDVILLGYGCRQVDGGGPSGSLYQGLSKVHGFSGIYIDTRGGAAVCFGDSGGGAYVSISSAQRRLIGVNSRGDIKTRSLLTPVTAPAVASFIATWAAENGVEVCGIISDDGRCQN